MRRRTAETRCPESASWCASGWKRWLRRGFRSSRSWVWTWTPGSKTPAFRCIYRQGPFFPPVHACTLHTCYICNWCCLSVSATMQPDISVESCLATHKCCWQWCQRWDAAFLGAETITKSCPGGRFPSSSLLRVRHITGFLPTVLSSAKYISNSAALRVMHPEVGS